MRTFDELAASRREWIETVLKPWCRVASLSDLKRAEAEWPDLAGRVAPEFTLWPWAWSRFPDLVHEGFPGVNETHEVRITLRDGTEAHGYPDNRNSRQGQLVLACRAEEPSPPSPLPQGEGGGVRVRSVERGPFSIDEIVSVDRVER